MRIVSIDIGIKNFAYCCIESTDDKQFSIFKWGVINFIGAPPTCQHNIIKKKAAKICNKKALFCKNKQYFCKTHAKKTQYIIPSDTTKLSFLRKRTISELIEILKIYKLEPSSKKKDILETLDNYLKENILSIIKPISSNDVSLIDIGIAISKSLDEHISLTTIDKIVIENQISPIAGRMKTIQGMVAQYFIMKGFYQLQFISAINKLKPFTSEKLNYQKRKTFSILITSKLIQENDLLYIWKTLFETHKKKDDLADCLLQGLWYLQKNNDIIIDSNKYLL